ncbi:hypothetical protein Q7P37_006785 [Cladosporium fusiforme]
MEDRQNDPLCHGVAEAEEAEGEDGTPCAIYPARLNLLVLLLRCSQVIGLLIRDPIQPKEYYLLVRPRSLECTHVEKEERCHHAGACHFPTDLVSAIAMSPPYTLGWVHNLEEAPAESDAASVIALAAAFSTIAVLFTVLRCIQRWKIVSHLGLDDYAIAASALLGVGYSAIAIYQTKWGLGLDQYSFPLENAVPFSRVQYAGGPIYCLAVLGFKVSLLGGYLRVAGFNRTYAILLYVALALVITSQLIFTFLLSFACTPIARQWDPSIPGSCIDTLPTYFALGGTSLAWDILIIILPFPILRRLQLDKRNKVAIAILYGLGFFVTIVQAIRIHTIAALATYTESKPIIQWSIVEINMGVIVACVPAFSPLLKSFGKKMSYNSRSRSGAYGQKSGTKGAYATHGSKSGTAPGIHRSVSKSRILASVRDEDEVELCDTKHGWVPDRNGWNAATVQHGKSSMYTHGTADESNPPDRSGASSPGDQHQITVVHEYTVQHGDAKGISD